MKQMRSDLKTISRFCLHCDASDAGKDMILQTGKSYFATKTKQINQKVFPLREWCELRYSKKKGKYVYIFSIYGNISFLVVVPMYGINNVL